VAGVEDEKGAPKEDTLRETPVSKGPISRPSIPDDWKPPPRRREMGKGSELARPDDLEPPSGARVDFVFGGARVRSFQVKGPFAALLALVVFALVGVILALMVVFAVGVGTALAVGAGVAAALGVGVAGVRRLTGGKRRELGRGDDH
jgi:hypothetical protein